MSEYESVSLKKLSYVFIGSTTLALAMVASVWGVLGIFVL